MNRKRYLLPIVAVLLLCGCTMAPKYTRPDAPVPSEWPKGAAYAEIKSPASAQLASELPWTEFITDERLHKVWRPRSRTTVICGWLL